jgi:hypothetical protein
VATNLSEAGGIDLIAEAERGRERGEIVCCKPKGGACADGLSVLGKLLIVSFRPAAHRHVPGSVGLNSELRLCPGGLPFEALTGPRRMLARRRPPDSMAGANAL